MRYGSTCTKAQEREIRATMRDKHRFNVASTAYYCIERSLGIMNLLYDHGTSENLTLAVHLEPR